MDVVCGVASLRKKEKRKEKKKRKEKESKKKKKKKKAENVVPATKGQEKESTLWVSFLTQSLPRSVL